MERRNFSRLFFLHPFTFNLQIIPVRFFKDKGRKDLIETRYYKKREKRAVSCELFSRNCYIEIGKRGFSKNHENRGGNLYFLVYYRFYDLQVDPVEKEPMFNFLPGTKIFCTETAEEIYFYFITPKEIVNLAKNTDVRLSPSLTMSKQYFLNSGMYNTVKIPKEEGLRTIFHSNGAISQRPLEDILKIIDGITIDLIAFKEEFYNEISSAYLEPVLESFKIIGKSSVWLEIVNLINPTYNDKDEDIKKMEDWIGKNLGTDVPIHFTSFFPSNNLRGLPPTPLQTLEKVHKISKATEIEFVYIRNYPGHKYNSTFCPSCGEFLIERFHFKVLKKNIENGYCKFCKKRIPCVWN
ncbi:MAG: AmmeMemoRadiSam system radical SAM enzyme [Candidatus Aminicenantia bacterium]